MSTYFFQKNKKIIKNFDKGMNDKKLVIYNKLLTKTARDGTLFWFTQIFPCFRGFTNGFQAA